MDSKKDQILSKPFLSIYSNVSNIYREDGKSLLKWVTEEYRLDSHPGEKNERKEANITSYKEQFKNMLSLDIWIEKLAQWQASGYKLEIPQKEPVDSLKWNTILKAKLKQAMRRGTADLRKGPNQLPTQPPVNRQGMPNPEASHDELYLRSETRKRRY